MAEFQVVKTTAGFNRWFRKLKDPQAKARIAVRIRRLQTGLFGDMREMGGQVFELRIDYGPGYRVYGTRTEGVMVLLLCGGDKERKRTTFAVRKTQPVGCTRRRGDMKTSEFRVEDYLDSDEMIAAYLTAALEEDDPEFFRMALGDVARARGMAGVAQAAGVGRESLYKSLSAEGTRGSERCRTYWALWDSRWS